MTSMCGRRLKYLRNGFAMLEMTQKFGKCPKYLGKHLDALDTA